MQWPFINSARQYKKSMTNKLLEQAQQQHQQGKLQEALDSYRELLEDDPNQPDVLHLAGIILVQMENYPEALDYFNLAIKLEPSTANFHNSKANLLMRTNELVEATKTYHIAISLKPNYAVAYNNLGNSFYRQNKINNAKKAYQKAIVLQPDFANAYFNYGRLLVEEESYPLAIKELKKTISLDKHHGPALSQLAQIYLYQGAFIKSIAYLKKRLTMEPDHAETHQDLGIAFLKIKQWTEAIKHLRQAIELEPNDKDANYNIATAYLHTGEHKKALRHYLRQIEIQSHLESYYNIGVLFMYEERHRDAIDYFKKALELDPNYFDAHVNIAAVYLKLACIDQATNHYRSALALKKNDPEILHILSALEQKETPKTAAPEYVQHLFDHYALHYDAHLTNLLDYKVPEQIYEAIEIDTNADNLQWKILDLGCGTGLCGALFKNRAKELIGVDISPQMIDMAEKKNIYDKLITADIQKTITEFYDVDLIVAADVLTYIGDLEMLFKNIKNSLKIGGIFTFTVEKNSIQPYTLQQTIRYAHSKKYLDQLIQKNQFEVLRCDNVVLRKQQNKPVEGLLISLKK